MKYVLLKFSSSLSGRNFVIVQYKNGFLVILFLFSCSTKSVLYHVVHSVSLNKLFNICMIYFQYDSTYVSSVV